LRFRALVVPSQGPLRRADAADTGSGRCFHPRDALLPQREPGPEQRQRDRSPATRRPRISSFGRARTRSPLGMAHRHSSGARRRLRALRARLPNASPGVEECSLRCFIPPARRTELEAGLEPSGRRVTGANADAGLPCEPSGGALQWKRVPPLREVPLLTRLQGILVAFARDPVPSRGGSAWLRALFGPGADGWEGRLRTRASISGSRNRSLVPLG
jgi:hypothetical protein